MSSYIENLTKRRDAIAEELANLTASKPNYTAGGRSYEWASLRESLLKELTEINKLIAVGEPFYIETRGEL